MSTQDEVESMFTMSKAILEDWLAEQDPALWRGVALSGTVYFAAAILHLVFPGKSVVGYVCSDDPKRTPLKYSLNGFLVSTVVLVSVMIGTVPSGERDYPFWTGAAQLYPFGLGCIVGGSVWGLLGSIHFYLRGKRWCRLQGDVNDEPVRCVTTDQVDGNKVVSPPPTRKRSLNGLTAFYRGVGEFNPRSANMVVRLEGDIDYKMWLYMAGTIMLQLQVLAMLGEHADQFGGISRAMGITSAFWMWFSVDYLSNERMHLYTYDLFAERLGLKLVWGCLGVYPFLYPIGQLVLVNTNDDLSETATLWVAALFLVGRILTRGATYQKYVFKTRPNQGSICLGLVSQKRLSATTADGRDCHLLVSGWWGLARHINYLGEILQGVAMGLPGFLVTRSPIALIYPIFITCFLLFRQRDVEALCRIKYGDQAWDEYTKRVPSRVVPLIY